MNRSLFLISNPGNPNDINYVKTTEDALDRWAQFFSSPIGGYWRPEEITRFGENRPIDPDSLRRIIDAVLNSGQCDYSIIVFCGHGACTSDGKDAIQLPIPDDTNHRLFPVSDLCGANSTNIRRTIILDSCRSLIPYSSEQLFETRYYSSIHSLDGVECSKYYDSLVMQAGPHIEILYSTSEHQKAYGSISSSQYADAMSNVVRIKSPIWKALAIMDKYGQFSYSMLDLQNDIKTDLAGSNDQVPDYTSIGRMNHSFPFAAIHLPTDRTLYEGDAIVDILND